ncbi:bifunctional transcriptional activator/DNA repair enzyme AdaA [Schleiferilactobacillus shenzhenensis]|uniref:AdaA n=1 Tax=Schleiferilactobacillus shenzhenensis LY-73 TaxID=1231336 RepID=U4TP16_9LACO|nr:Ada metal-binding domain-containing protein [Schleiferilactobacillus shenzhenensis]ERL65954.1 AdaA [Schleiferilactobacillus shenzhenensis LY-73]
MSVGGVPTDAQWAAITTNDTAADGQFWYAVQSTMIFCRPSCPSRLPKRENVTVYADPHAALAAGYRPCKRCRPLAQPVSNATWVAEIDTLLATHSQEPLTLNELASLAHGSASYLRHVYQAATGATPLQRLKTIRLTRAKALLTATDLTVAQIGVLVGIPTTSYFIAAFRTVYGQTPLQFRRECQKRNC